MHSAGKQAILQGNYAAALEHLQDAATRTSARENDYAAVLEDLRQLYLKTQHLREALSIDWYRQETAAAASLLENVPASDRARTYEAWAAMDQTNKRVTYFAQAAKEYLSCNMRVRAAVCLEKAGHWQEATQQWQRVSSQLAYRPKESYANGLAHFNIARCWRELSNEVESQKSLVDAVHCLEEAADQFERLNQRERAFDCYQVLIAIGDQSGQFEHVLEGYVNVIRILREDNLRYYALQCYEDVVQVAEEQSEFSASATLALEFAQYARAQQLSELHNFALARQSLMWRKAAEATLLRNGPTDVAENAMLAAIVSLARQGQFADVGKLYAALAELDLEESRKKHYLRASRRYETKQNSTMRASPLAEHLRQQASYPEVWHVDMIEWEQQGSAAAACGDIVLEADNWSEITRRHALLARLKALAIERAQTAQTLDQARLANDREQLVGLLGNVQLYTILSPLESLYDEGSPSLRVAVLTALKRFMYKRTFVTVREALKSDMDEVTQTAYKTTEALRFPHAFDPLARIFRDTSDEGARQAALRAIGRIDTLEAAELLLAVLQHEDNTIQELAVDVLKRTRGRFFPQTARAAFQHLPAAAQKNVRRILQARGENI